MESALADEAIDAGEYTLEDAEFFQSVCDLFDTYVTEYAADQPLDYSAVEGETLLLPD